MHALLINKMTDLRYTKIRLAKEAGIKPGTLYYRFEHGGWLLREALAVAKILGISLNEMPKYF